MRIKRIKVLSLLILVLLLFFSITACDLFSEKDSQEIDDIEIIAEEISSKPVDYLNLRKSEMQFTVQGGIQEGVITFTTESSFNPIAIKNERIQDKIELSNGEAVLDLYTFAENEKLMVTVETAAGEQLYQLTAILDNVEPIMASNGEILEEKEEDFDLDTPRFGFFMSPSFESTVYDNVEHDFYSYYNVSKYLDLGVDELTAVVVHMLENPDDSFFVNSAFDNGYSSFANFREYGSTNLQNEIDNMADFYDKAGLDEVGHVGGEGKYTGKEIIPEKYRLSVEKTGTGNGLIKVEDVEEKLPFDNMHKEGEEVFLEAIAGDHSTFKHWVLADDKKLTNPEYTINMPAEDKFLEVKFDLKKYNLTFEAVPETIEQQETPVTLTAIVEDADKNLVEGLELFFKILSGADDKTKLSENSVITNANGEALTELKLADNQLAGDIEVQVDSANFKATTTSVTVKQVADTLEILDPNSENH